MRIRDAELKRLLASSGKVKPEDIKAIERIHAQTKKPLLQSVLDKKLLTEKELAELYGKSIGVPYVELADKKVPRDILVKIPERISRKYQAVLFGKDNGRYQLAMADPEDIQAADFIEKQIGQDVRIYITLPGDILNVQEQYKGNIEGEITQAIKETAPEDESQEVSAKDLAEDAPIAKTVNIILEYALKSRASDVHIEPREGLVQVRYRVDGVLQEAMTLPKNLLAAVVSRIKILANLKIDEHRIPQDGRFKFSLGSKTVALRVSTLPIMDGEKVVMRLLDESSKPLNLEELGFEGRALDIIQRNLTKPHGMTLVTGPTGSGKSTTLYSLLNIMNSPGVNISTVEDPVEYRIVGVNQTQVNTKTGMTFATGLRALLRQDPNIIMVGEIRDRETADLAVQASLTGHVVLSTLHTNNAATCLPRLLDMNIEPFLIASTVNTVIGQRLVRKLCPTCRAQYVPTGKEMDDIREDFQVDEALKRFADFNELHKTDGAALNKPVADTAPVAEIKHRRTKVIAAPENIKEKKGILDKIASDPNIINRSTEEAKAVVAQPATSTTPAVAQPVDPAQLKPGEFIIFRAGKGCAECNETGYTGRMGIYEVLEVDETIGKMIVNHATSEEIQLSSIRSGMITMQQDGFIKVLRGQTSIEEILRVTRE